MTNDSLDCVDCEAITLSLGRADYEQFILGYILLNPLIVLQLSFPGGLLGNLRGR